MKPGLRNKHGLILNHNFQTSITGNKKVKSDNKKDECLESCL